MTRRVGWGRWVPALVLCAILSEPNLAYAQVDAEISPADSNLVANPGFERPRDGHPLPADWSGDSLIYGRDDTVARSGNASLRHVNSDPGVYRLCVQRLPLVPNCKYRFGAYIRTEDIGGEESGATVCLEWQAEDGSYLGGSYPPGVRGTRNWTRVESITRIPPRAASVSIICYVRKGMTGRAWYDDVEVVEVREPLMRTLLISPVYRGWITGEGPDSIHLKGRVSSSRGNGLFAVGRLCSGDGRVLHPEIESEIDANMTFDFEFSAAGLELGEYEASVSLFDSHGDMLQTDRHHIVRQDDDFEPAVFVDEHRRLIVEGEPFFPIGMYWSTIDEADLALYADSKFNCLMPYASPDAEEMNLISRYGLKVIYSMKDFFAGSRWAPGFIKTEDDEEPHVRARVRQFRDHPALLAWYLNDELPEPYLPRLEAHYEWTKEEDPNHPAWAVLCEVPEVGRYLDTFDVIGTDPYPLDREPISLVADWTEETQRQVHHARPLWQVVQAFNRGNYPGMDHGDPAARTPTYLEMHNMVWQCICEGATGIFFYSFQDIKRNPDVRFETQWWFLKMIAAAVDRMAPVLLSTEPVPDVTVESESETLSWLHWTIRVHDGRLYVFAVSDGNGEGQVTFRVPAKRLTRVASLMSTGLLLEPRGDAFDARADRVAASIYEIWWEDE